MLKMNLLRLFLSIELVLFVVGIVGYAVLLHIVRSANRERLIRILSTGQKQTIADIKEKVVKSAAKLKKVRVELFISAGVLVISLLFLWYLNKVQQIPVALTGEFYLLGIMVVSPLPFCVWFLEYLYREIAERIEKLEKLSNL